MAADEIDFEIIDQDFHAVVRTLGPGEGLFPASLEGPGRVWMQTMPFSRLPDRSVEATTRPRRET